jgi:hypothetical protein
LFDDENGDSLGNERVDDIDEGVDDGQSSPPDVSS